jgi:hypothetical protein
MATAVKNGIDFDVADDKSDWSKMPAICRICLEPEQLRFKAGKR